jgi:hypothetical protein
MSPMELKMQPTIHFQRKALCFNFNIQLFIENVLWVGISIPLDSYKNSSIFSKQNKKRNLGYYIKEDNNEDANLNYPIICNLLSVCLF